MTIEEAADKLLEAVPTGKREAALRSLEEARAMADQYGMEMIVKITRRDGTAFSYGYDGEEFTFDPNAVPDEPDDDMDND
jgi:hypothetical protein